MSAEPAVSVVVPTRNRAAYLQVALASLREQTVDGGHEVIVVDDGSTDSTARVTEEAGARLIRQPRAQGPNAARNRGIAAARSGFVALVDDDVLAPPGWLAAMVDGSERHPQADVFGGPIRARFEGPAPRSCGREEPPVTTLDLGPRDREVERVWSANLALRRSIWERIGPFPEAAPVGGDEEEWLVAVRRGGARIVYLAAAGLDHRRVGDDARLRSLAASAFGRGRNLRAWDVRRGEPPSLTREARVLAGCAWHAARRGCPQGLIAGAHSAGRLMEALRPR